MFREFCVFFGRFGLWGWGLRLRVRVLCAVLGCLV